MASVVEAAREMLIVPPMPKSVAASRSDRQWAEIEFKWVHGTIGRTDGGLVDSLTWLLGD